MKRSLLFLSSFFLVVGLLSPTILRADDHPSRNHKKTPPDIATIVTDLTPTQKKKIEQTRNESNARIQMLEDQLQKVRDSIRMYMDSYEDKSNVLNPLFEREGKIETDINKEKYRTKSAINKLLTPVQYKQLVDYFKKVHQQKMDGKRLEKQSRKSDKMKTLQGREKPSLKKQ